MIDKALIFLKNEVNKHLKLKTGEENKLSLSSIVEQNGETQIENLGLTLVSIKEERVNKAQNIYRDLRDGDVNLVNPEIKLNLYILFTANFEKNYDEALKFLSHVISFFQSKNVFTRQNSPAMDENIEKLIAELLSLSFEEQNNLWGALGAKYMPSVMYKIKMLIIQEDKTLVTREPIKVVDQEYLNS